MESASPRRTPLGLSPAGIETLADGVFAIAITPSCSTERCPNSLPPFSQQASIDTSSVAGPDL